MRRCSICKKFVRNITYSINLNDDISNVTGWCKHCHKRVEVEYDCYEDIVGFKEVN